MSSRSIGLAKYPGIFGLPVELMTIIAEHLLDEDLRNLSCVSRHMADIGCPIYLRRRQFIVSPSSHWITVCADGFKALSVWRRSPTFSGLPRINFIFDAFDPSLRILEMHRLEIFFTSLPLRSPSLFGHISLYNVESPTLQNCLTLLRTVSMLGCHGITIGNVAFQDARTGSWKGVEGNAVQLTGVRELQLQGCQLSPSQWLNLLSNIYAPSLLGLTILGNTSMVAIYHFIRRHPNICQLDLKCTSVDTPISSRWLNLPGLERLHGSPSHILHLLQSLPSVPSICELVIDCNSLASLPCGSLIGVIMHSLTMCKGTLALEINFLSKEASKAELTRVDIPALATYGFHRATLPCNVSTLSIQFEAVCDEFIQVLCLSAIKIPIQVLTPYLPGLLRVLDDSVKSPRNRSRESGNG